MLSFLLDMHPCLPMFLHFYYKNKDGQRKTYNTLVNNFKVTDLIQRVATAMF